MNKKKIQSKIRGFFLGTAIGDSLGMCVETWTHEEIKKEYGIIRELLPPTGHKYLKGLPAGATTDDTQLTLAVAEGIIKSNGLFNLDEQVLAHIKAYDESVAGWGRSTKEALKRLKSGVSYKESGVCAEKSETVKKPMGFGNGVSMKCGPLGIQLALRFDSIWKDLADFTGMTHASSVAVSGCFAHVMAVFKCFLGDENFSMENFISSIQNVSRMGEEWYPQTLTDKMSERLDLLRTIRPNTTTEEIIEKFVTGSFFYVYVSQPFTYAFFVKNPGDIESLYECASGGGDTDTNASMLGGLQGALYGDEFFPKHLVDGLQNKDKIIEIADQFMESIKP